MEENKNENMVSVATLAEHYGQYRWTLERDSAGRFAGLWALIGGLLHRAIARDLDRRIFRQAG